MKPLNLTEVTDYVEKNISSFHEKRIESLDSLKLSRILKRKNPYLFKAKMITDFKKAKRTLRTSNSQFYIIAVNGCCYGKDSRPDKGDHFKYCGQKFWGFISGSDNLYLDIIEPLGHNAKQKNEVYMESYGKMVNKFVKEFINGYCTPEGAIDWAKLIYFNSGTSAQ